MAPGSGTTGAGRCRGEKTSGLIMLPKMPDGVVALANQIAASIEDVLPVARGMELLAEHLVDLRYGSRFAGQTE